MRFYPDKGALRRELYRPHTAFFEAGAKYRERCIMAANRIGKSEGVGGYETTLHLTGLYPDWWVGRRFGHAISAWAAGDTSQTVRDIAQYKLVGRPGEEGSGLIPGDHLAGIKKKAGSVPDAIETILVKHISGGISRLTFKSYDQKRKSFQGTEQDVIWLDEECPEDIYGECLIRTMTTNGLVLLTFTPLQGLTPVVLKYMPDGEMPESGADQPRFVVNATWDDAPHLTERDKAELFEATPPHLRDARSKGVPYLGAGAIYPVPEEDIKVDPFEFPEWWPRVYAMDVGWNRTAALWGALDRESDTIYLYSEYYRGQAEPPIHAAAVLSRGRWIPGVIDPAARGRGQRDGMKLFDDYEQMGLSLTQAENAVESGIYQVWTRLSTGKIKVFSTLRNWFTEYRLYRRNEDGKIVQDNDHLMDCTRYLVLSGLDVALAVPVQDDPDEWRNRQEEHQGRSRVGGY
jgi:phage terminase large subunit-like protein